MLKPDLNNAYEKLKRANRHIAELEGLIDANTASELYRVSLEADMPSGLMALRCEGLHRVDKAINAVIGDAIGNLRSVLDYATVALVAPITGSTRGIGFPFADNANGFIGEVKCGALAACEDSVRDHFINDVQAYAGGKGHAFWTVNKLRNIDKHRLLITAVSVASIAVSLTAAGGRMSMTGSRFHVKTSEDRLLVIGIPGDAVFTDEPKPAFEVYLREPPYIAWSPVMTFLQTASSEAKSFLNALEMLA